MTVFLIVLAVLFVGRLIYIAPVVLKAKRERDAYDARTYRPTDGFLKHHRQAKEARRVFSRSATRNANQYWSNKIG